MFLLVPQKQSVTPYLVFFGHIFAIIELESIQPTWQHRSLGFWTFGRAKEGIRRRHLQLWESVMSIYLLHQTTLITDIKLNMFKFWTVDQHIQIRRRHSLILSDNL